jgi:hypothetical protein
LLTVVVGTVAVPGVTIGRWDEDAAVTDGTVAVPAVTPGGVACILRDAQARLRSVSDSCGGTSR